MDSILLSKLLLIYGCFLILCGVTAVIFIGLKAKTALLSGGFSGGIILLLSWLSIGHYAAAIAALVVTVGLVIVFSWRATKTLFAIFNLLKYSEGDLKGKGIAFLIIALMAIMSFIFLVFQMLLLLINF